MHRLAIAVLGLLFLPSPAPLPQVSPETGLNVPLFSRPDGATRYSLYGYPGDFVAGRTYRLTTTERLSTIADHYRKEIEAVGWRVSLAQSHAALSLTRFTRPAADPR